MPKLQQPLWGTWFPADFAYSKFSCSSHVRLTGKCGWELPGITRLAGPSDKRVSQDRALQLGRKMFERILSFAAGRPPGRGPRVLSCFSVICGFSRACWIPWFHPGS